MDGEALGWREQAFAAFTQAVTEALIAWDLDGRVRVFNVGAERLYGYAASAIVDHEGPLPLLAGEAGPWPPRTLPAPVSLELIRVRQDGVSVAILAQLVPIRDAAGALVGVAEIGRPAPHPLALARTQQQAAKLHLSAIVESSEDAIISKSLKGIIQSWNRGAERVFGYTAEEAVGRPVTMLIPDDRRDEEEAILSRIRAGERVQHYETVRVRRDGRLIRVSLTVSPVYDVEGRIVGASKIARDITAQRLAEQALADSEERLRTVLEVAPVILFACDTAGRLTLLRGPAVATLGLKSEGLLGRPFTGLSRGPAATFSEYLVRALAGVRGATIIGIAGRLMDVRFLPVTDADGRISGVGGVAIDVTNERKRHEEALRATKWEALSALAGGIAHDFNNVLAAIVGNLGLARIKIDADSEVARFIQESEKAALQARGLTRQLLGLTDRQRPVRHVVDLSGLIESTVRFALGGSNVRADILVVRDLWPVWGDEGQLSQVLNNLVINAQQAMSQGGVLEVLARNVSLAGHESGLAAGDYVRVDCVDHGSGIDQADLARIFDPYFTTKPHGSGLGLTTSARIIRDHGGLIEMVSNPKDGTRARFYLPRFVEQRPPARGPLPLQSKGRILFMDDDEPVRKVAHAMLSYLGYDVCLTADGSAALREYQKGTFDVVILDLTVRDGLGGLATLERLRALNPGVLAIVSSGYSSDPVMADHERYGFAAKVPKPYTPEALDAAIVPLVARARADRLGGQAAPARGA